MTVVEFFDGVSINNMVSCLAIKPEKIIFVGQKKMMRKQEEAYRRFVSKHGIQVTFEFRPVNVNNLEKLIELLTEIVENEDECTFDLTGGEDTVLVAMGIVYEKYHTTKKVQMHRFNINTGVASRFGGPYAKKVLVVTSAANQSKNGYEYLCQRAEDMKIQILENVHIFTDDEFERKISNLLC